LVIPAKAGIHFTLLDSCISAIGLIPLAGRRTVFRHFLFTIHYSIFIGSFPYHPKSQNAPSTDGLQAVAVSG
ncbi:MAG TPA: hypothetical protein VJC18_11565, partial [bacterium]|nr:hypothetical protein [bacterium]